MTRGVPVGNAVPAGNRTSVCVWPSNEWVLVEAISEAGGTITPAEEAEVLVSFKWRCRLRSSRTASRDSVGAIWVCRCR